MADDESAALLAETSVLIVKALGAMNITSLTAVQKASFPLIRSGCDVMSKAKTGTGKTLAFLVPTIEKLLAAKATKVDGTNADPIRAIVLSSTRELANQIVDQAKKLTKFIPNFNVECILGGTAIVPQRSRLDPNSRDQFPYGGAIDILIATPGRLIEHIESTSGMCDRLLGCETLVLDEVDQLLETGFQKDITAIISKLKQVGRQSLCFSATVPDKVLPVLRLALREGYETVDCVGEQTTATHDKIEQRVIIHTLEDSLIAAYMLITEQIRDRPDSYKIMAFLPTARQTQFLTAVFLELGLEVLEIHSRRNQKQRTEASDAFRAATTAVLFSSDVSARGVDYPNVSLVLQVGPPASKEVYIQRLGRTGRAGESGSGCLLLCPFEAPFMQQLKGLPVADVSGSLAAFKVANAPSIAALSGASARVDEELATQTYSAWLKAYNGIARKSFKWTKEDLVRNANKYALSVLGRSAVPPLDGETAAIMGLRGIKELNIVDGLGNDSSASLNTMVSDSTCADSDEEELQAKPDKKEIGIAFRDKQREVFDLISSLHHVEASALRDALDRDGSAVLMGYVLLSNMVTFSAKPRKGPSSVSRSSSNTSLSSMGMVLSRQSTPGLSLSRNSSATSLRQLASNEDLTAASCVAALKPTQEEIDVVKSRVAAAGELLRSCKATSSDSSAAEEEMRVARAEMKRLVALSGRSRL